MYYKLTIEKLDEKHNAFQMTSIMVNEEMAKDASLEFDVLKLTANNLVDRFRHDFEKSKGYEENN